MKLAIAFAAVLAVASAQFPGFGSTARPGQYRPIYPSPQPPPRPVVINRVVGDESHANTINYINDIGPDGSYNHAFDTDNGISAQAQGTPRDFGGNPPVVSVVSQGSFSWTSPEGQPIAISYTADENGYKATGDAIPTPHPIPVEIQRAIEWNLRNPQSQKK